MKKINLKIIKDKLFFSHSKARMQYLLLRDIEDLKSQLTATDYKVLKYTEGLINEAEYTSIKEERQFLRDRINNLEQQYSIISNE